MGIDFEQIRLLAREAEKFASPQDEDEPAAPPVPVLIHRDLTPTIQAGPGECGWCSGPADHSEAACQGIDPEDEDDEE